MENPESVLELSPFALKTVAAARRDIEQGKLFSSKKMTKELGFWHGF